jgi:hypothetical protein
MDAEHVRDRIFHNILRPETYNLIDGPTHHNFDKRKGLWVDHRVITPVNPLQCLEGLFHGSKALPVVEDAATGSDMITMTYICWEAQKLFSDDEGTGVASFARDNFIPPRIIFIDSDFRDITMNAFLAKYEDAGPDVPMFQCSAGFVAMFKAQHRLTSRKIHFKCRSSVTDEQRQRRVANIQEDHQMVSWDWILNCDQTTWLLYRNGMLICPEIGTESVQAKI